MPTITFQPDNRRIDVEPGTLLLEAARAAGIALYSPCGGSGTCGKCRCRILSGKVETPGTGHLSLEEIDSGYVLACTTRAGAESLTIEIPRPAQPEQGRFDDSVFDFELIDPALMPPSGSNAPLAETVTLTVPLPQAGDGLSDFDRFTRRLRADTGAGEITCPLPALRTLADALRAENGLVTTTKCPSPGGGTVVRICAGRHADKNYGVAVDIGTTTVSCMLVDCAQGTPRALAADYNDQIACGLDVISRINYARKPNQLAELRQRIVATVNSLLSRVVEQSGVAREDICAAAISGNTTMIHLLLGLAPEYIRCEPYTPTLLAVPALSARDIGIEINPDAVIHIAPAVGSYVGGDIIAGLLCTALAADTGNVNLFLDIGTNGELVLGNCDFLMACACSAGPAFEGGGIGCGMRASQGAIDSVGIDGPTGMPAYTTIGGGAPAGICGTGMISLIANLFLSGWLDGAGKLSRDRKSPAIDIDGRRGRYTLAGESQSASGRPIAVTEADIESLIRAKAAIYSACSLLLAHADMIFGDVDTFYIAGGFGRSLDLRKAIALGLLPDLPLEKFRYVGNASLAGSFMALMSERHRALQRKLAGRMTYLELNTEPSYMDQYTGALFLPHTDRELFPNVLQTP